MRAAVLLLASLALASCGGSELPTPQPLSVTPDRGSVASATPIVVHGTSFSVLTVQATSGGEPKVDDTFQAWLGDLALQEVRRIDAQTLSALVPAGLAPGPKTLRVQGPFGTSGDLANAFTVEGSAPASISAAIVATPARVSVGQSVTVTLTVTNTSTVAATHAVPDAPLVTGTATLGAATGPAPASIATLAPGAAGTFTWTYPATGAGTLSFAGAASATDALAGTTVTAATDPASPAQVTVELPAALTASLPASGGAAFGQEFTVTMTVTNQGGAAAKDVVPSAPTTTPPGMAALKAGTGPVPASVATLTAGASAGFTWTFVAGNTQGAATFTSSASGTDANSGAAAESGSTTSGAFIIGAAGLDATLSAAPPTVLAGQAVTLTLTVTNPGLAELRNFTVSVPASSSADGASATLTVGPSPVPPTALGAGQILTLTWTFTPVLAANVRAGHLAFLVTTSGTDALSGGSITARPTAQVTVQAPAEVTATGLATTPGTLTTGQAFTATLTLARTGSAVVNVTGASLTGTTCATPPITPVNAIGATLRLTWSGCTAPPTPQTLSLVAYATWVDASEPLVPLVTNSTSAEVIVQAPVALAVSFAGQPPSPVSGGQAVNLVANVQNLGAAGGSAANGVRVTPTATRVAGTAAATCGAAAPASAAIAGGSSQAFAFTCTVSGSGTLSFTATASGTAEGTGAPLIASATTAPATTVLAAAGLAVTFAAQPPSSVRIGQVVAFTANVRNTAPAGGSAASGVTVAPSVNSVSGKAAATCAAATPVSVAIAANTIVSFHFTCTPTKAGTLTFTATASGTAAGSGAALSAAATTTPATTVLK